MRRAMTVLFFVVLLVLACENEKKTVDYDTVVTDTVGGADGDTLITDEVADEAADEMSDEAADEPTDDDGGFDPEHPGYNVFFQIMTMEVFGNPMAMAFGLIMKTAREDLETTEEEKPEVDTCVFVAGGDTPTPSCTSKDDCAPEQECLPETDNNGKPVPGTERCVTPNRESLDRGPVIIEGFVGGPATFLYEPNDKVYKLNGTGDGSIDMALLTFNATYELSGEGQDDLAAFSSSVFLPPSLALVSPEPTTGGTLPFPTITINPSADLTIEWAEPNPDGTMDLTVTGEQGSVVCRVKDDGEFVVPADLLSQVQFGVGFNMMANNLILDRKYTEPMTGSSITAGTFNTEEMVMYIINAQP